ncbi:MAG TPA: NUDIX hydrolase [Pyrinomonadaceae bacterium]|nr:NUDIX hydrolase [Pyrinomonadaceae bacterium]
MFKRFLGSIFRRAPSSLRRFYSRFFNDQFSVTAGAVVIDANDRILLLKHVFRAGSGWGIPGGFIKAGEQPEEAVRRELMEEVGLELGTTEVAFIRTLRRMRQVEVLFLCTPNGIAEPRSVEIERAEWFPLTALPEALSKDQHFLIQRTLSHRAKRPT